MTDQSPEYRILRAVGYTPLQIEMLASVTSKPEGLATLVEMRMTERTQGIETAKRRMLTAIEAAIETYT